MVGGHWRTIGRTGMGVALCIGLVMTAVPGAKATSASLAGGRPSAVEMSITPLRTAAALASNGRIVFRGTIGGHTGIYSVWPGGSGLRLLVKGAVGAPRYDPAGRRIAFTRCKPSCDIWVMRFDGTDLRRAVGGPGWQGEPSWSPNGKKIVYVGDADAPKPGRQVFIARLGAGAARQITFAKHRGGPFAQAPSWSPDGRRIVFEQFIRGAEGYFFDSTLMAIQPSGRDEQVVASGWVSMEGPDWSPTGDLILFTRVSKNAKYGDRELGLGTVRPDDSHTVRITDTGESEPAWAPDAEWIAYYDGTSTLDGGGHERGLMVMARDGSSARLVANAKNVTGIDWQPLP